MGKRATKSKAKRMEEVVANSVQEEVVELPPTEDGMEIIERALAEAPQPEEIQPEDVEKLHEDLAAMKGDEEAPKEPNSIVKDKFKIKYIENAKALGIPGKAARRSNWDWLSQMLAQFCLSDKGKIDIGAFKDVLDANGVDHSKWTNQNKGWEGRFRMTGRVALQKVVANAGELKWPGLLDSTPAPADFIAKFKTKA